MRVSRLLLAPAAALLIGAAPPAPSFQPSAEAVNRVRADVEFLADDLLEGRGAGKRGHEVAALYVASQFRAIGLRPTGDNGSWYQRVPFRRASHEGTPTAALLGAGGRQALRWGTDIAVRPSVSDRVRQIDTPLVFAGWGLTDPRHGLASYAGLDVRGKTVVVLAGTPRGLPSEVAAHLSQQKDEFAAAAGAVGLIEISPASGRRLGPDRPTTDWVDPNGQAGSIAQGLRFRGNLSADLAERLFSRAPMAFGAVTAAARQGTQIRGFDLLERLSLDARSTWEEFTSPAVIGRLPGADPRLSAEHVVLMGHLDHLGLKPDAKPGEDAVYNGALDNAAGIATMLEAAREFVRSGKRPKRSLLFIAHTAEEMGLLGAAYFAAHPTVPANRIVAAVNLDMPVPLYDFTDVVAFGADHSTVARTVASAGRTMGIGVSPDPMPEQGIFTRSDHYPFVLRGIPSVLLFTGYGNGGKPIWDKFFAQDYHRVSDDLKQPINWTAAARYAQLNYRIARQLADSPERPRWYQGSYFGDIVAPGQAKAAR